MSNVANQVHCMSVSAGRNFSVSFSPDLDAGELLTGTPTVTEVGGSDLSITNKVVNTAIISVNGENVPIGEAVQFFVTEAGAGSITAGKIYVIEVSCATDSTPAQTLVNRIKFEAVP